MSAPRWDEVLDLEWEAECALLDADWAVVSAQIDLDGERTGGEREAPAREDGPGDGRAPDL